jgi:hypothetical protein
VVREKDQWDFTFSVDKRSAGNAPEGSGVAVGIVYHWYVVAHQIVKKADVTKYTTTMTGIKYKLAHKRTEQENWNITEHTQKKLLIRILEGLAIQLKVPYTKIFRLCLVYARAEDWRYTTRIRSEASHIYYVTINNLDRLLSRY